MEYFHQELFNKTPANTRVKAFSTRDYLTLNLSSLFGQEMVRYDSPDGKFTINYPKEWILKEGLANFDFFINEPKEDSIQVLTNIVVKSSESLSISLETRLKLKKLDLKNSDHFKDANLSDLKKITFNEVTAYQYIGTALVQGYPTKWSQFFFNQNEHYIEITATSSSQKFDEHRSLTSQVINSFVWK